jgi:hypothetical protein
MTEEFSSECNSPIGGISALLFLHFTSEDEHLCCRVLNFKLNIIIDTSLRIVAASEVTKVLSMWLTTIFLRATLI